ncbi:MAG: ferritin-like domain-containing protein [Alphaproteobacteria bacterium]|nr:ferritin-like domain-containing protein [Alphaproteobacteria bacterium]
MSGPKNLKDLFVHTLKDVYYAEQQLVKAIPKMEELAADASLKKGFKAHHKQTQNHVKRLEKVFGLVDVKPSGEKCDGIDGIIKEAETVMKEVNDEKTRDAAIIAAAQAAEHYEIARYGALVSWAERLGLEEAKNILRDTLAEEKDEDSKLTRLAEDKLNAKAKA